eukprot:914274-Pelagomonas_calceolata.AAC.4
MAFCLGGLGPEADGVHRLELPLPGGRSRQASAAGWRGGSRCPRSELQQGGEEGGVNGKEASIRE